MQSRTYGISPKLCLRDVRRILIKLRDLEFGNKVDDLFDVPGAKGDGSQPAVIECTAACRRFVSCVASEDDPRLRLLKGQLLIRLDRLVSSLESHSTANRGRRRMPSAPRVEAILAFSRFERYARTRAAGLNYSCEKPWASMVNQALAVWGDRI